MSHMHTNLHLCQFSTQSKKPSAQSAVLQSWQKFQNSHKNVYSIFTPQIATYASQVLIALVHKGIITHKNLIHHYKPMLNIFVYFKERAIASTSIYYFSTCFMSGTIWFQVHRPIE